VPCDATSDVEASKAGHDDAGAAPRFRIDMRLNA
jgi:hypothetical protein